jgi:hypothetical protein
MDGPHHPNSPIEPDVVDTQRNAGVERSTASRCFYGDELGEGLAAAFRLMGIAANLQKTTTAAEPNKTQ